jgi:NAD(P)-dependent dehydrogenase (short-subunit alcohol dehydrogenase family)
MPVQKRNATAAVIGAGDFIGAEIAKKFASEGFSVFAGRRNDPFFFNLNGFQRTAHLADRLRRLGKRLRRERDGFVEHVIKTSTVIGSPGFERDEDDLRRFADRRLPHGRRDDIRVGGRLETPGDVAVRRQPVDHVADHQLIGGQEDLGGDIHSQQIADLRSRQDKAGR